MPPLRNGPCAHAKQQPERVAAAKHRRGKRALGRAGLVRTILGNAIQNRPELNQPFAEDRSEKQTRALMLGKASASAPEDFVGQKRFNKTAR